MRGDVSFGYFGRMVQECICSEVLFRDGEREWVVCREVGVELIVRLTAAVRWEMVCRVLRVPVTEYQPTDSATL